MTSASPNIPDVEPDYVDLAAAVAGSGREAAFSAIVPKNTARNQPGAGTKAEASGAEISEHRRDECVPNVPDSQPDFVDSPAAGGAVRILRDGEEEAESPIGKAAPSFFRLGHWTVALAVFSLFSLLVFSQALSALTLAQSLPVWARWLLLAPMGLCVLILLVLAVGLAVAWFRLRSLVQVDLAALAELDRRSATRREGVHGFRTARVAIEEYLAAYPLEGEGRRRLRKAGCAPETLEALLQERDWLFRRKTDSLSWLDDFRTHFQDRVDREAKARIRAWSLKAGFCALASPIPLLDAILVLGVCLRLLGDVATIYNVRCGRLAALALFNRTVFAAFLAGAAGAVGEAAAEELSELAGEAGLGAALGGAVGLASAKLAEGAANALFVGRLGRAAQSLLRPLRPK
ncbi:MAG: DUF697 domain-containing protein [Planctomycetota bacterium]|jgi:uncharacterized membrane protein YcjF (UPF0283 family)|nr:DUF697 domain-containing protein [Planctomycetota bacterium]